MVCKAIALAFHARAYLADDTLLVKPGVLHHFHDHTRLLWED